MKKKRILTAAALITGAALILIVLIIVWNNKASNYLRILELNWGISFSAAAELSEVYANDSGASFHGDGIRYHVYSCKHAQYLVQDLDWTKEESATIYHPNFHEAANDWLDQINVPESERPAYSGCSYWYASQEDNSEIIIFWDSIESLLYIIESFL